jgi:DNA-binding NarL/FixJ family response regulator
MIHSPPYDTASDIPEMLTAGGFDAVESDAIEVIVIDDHLGMRKGLELLLRQEGLRVAGVAGGLEEARALLERRRHDVALIDVHLGNESSLGLVEERLRTHPDAAIVLYTGYTEGLAGAARIGARGFVLKSSPPAYLIDALRAVAGGGHYVDENLAGALVEHASTAVLSVLSGGRAARQSEYCRRTSSMWSKVERIASSTSGSNWRPRSAVIMSTARPTGKAGR